MNKILFENGTLVTPAKVVIDGVAYEVIPAIYSGDTPFNSENLIQMQNNIESAIDTLKIAVLKNCIDDPKEIANVVAERTQSQVVQVIGKKIVLYKPFKQDPKIILPK